MSESTSNSTARRRRKRTTSPRVRWADRVARAVISVGGVAVILAVLGILVYLVVVAAPLFGGAELTATASFPLVAPSDAGRVLFAELDEYGAMGTYLVESGELVAFAASDGETVSRTRLFSPEKRLTAWSRPPAGEDLAIGFADGSVHLFRLGFSTQFVTGEAASALDAATGSIVDNAVVERTTQGQWRRVSLELEDRGPVDEAASGAAVTRLDYRPSDSISRLVRLGADGELVLEEIEQRTNLMTGEVSSEVSSTRVPYPHDVVSSAPDFLKLSGNGQQLVAAWRDGSAWRFDLRDRAQPSLAERTQLTTTGVELTAFRYMLGDQSILAGDSTGTVRAWFTVPRTDEPWARAVTTDGRRLVAAHSFVGRDSAVTALATSLRDKCFLVGDAAGELRLYHMTSEQLLSTAVVPDHAPAVVAQIGPKSDAIFVLSAGGQSHRWWLDNPHPETTFLSLFREVWYEGAATPGYTWQSSSGTDDFEPKLSLIPLIFGTLKATLYSMLFAVPVALLAAIYTSEFLDRRLRSSLKSLVEVMASLPSVVLGFIAALVLAPIVERFLIEVGLGFALLPVGALLFGHVWQVLPQRFTLSLDPRLRFVFLLLVVLAAVGAAMVFAGGVEAKLFGGDVKRWLDGKSGVATPGWIVLLSPLVWCALLLLDQLAVMPLLARVGRARSSRLAAVFELTKALAWLGLAIAIASFAGSALTAVGLDPRPEVVGTYVQRNATVVGFLMGFAVIPIIYTIAEDALNSVPTTLRSASLGCGATRWQTAIRVVLPVAASGIFSALMIGLGRAVGETMIVLMAAGNTPVLELNPFSGLRTLSANIAVELPEAVKDGTLYRVLFLAALTLFVFTFLVNTVAEIVRQRFRRRAFEL